MDVSKNNSELIKYHQKQFIEPYRSTVAFCEWLESLGALNSNSKLKIVDMACGQGANIFYMKKRYPLCCFTGIELNPELVAWGNKHFHDNNIQDCKLEVGDLYNLNKNYVGKYDALVCYQTLSYLPEYEISLTKILNLQSKWIGLTSLFFDGKVNCKIEIQDYTKTLSDKPYKEIFYNIYSLYLVQKLFEKHGYKNFKYKWFEIDIDLPKPTTNRMGTYTEKLSNGKRIQISGPVLMNWYFIYAEK